MKNSLSHLRLRLSRFIVSISSRVEDAEDAIGTPYSNPSDIDTRLNDLEARVTALEAA